MAKLLIDEVDTDESFRAKLEELENYTALEFSSVRFTQEWADATVEALRANETIQELYFYLVKEGRVDPFLGRASGPTDGVFSRLVLDILRSTNTIKKVQFWYCSSTVDRQALVGALEGNTSVTTLCFVGDQTNVPEFISIFTSMVTAGKNSIRDLSFVNCAISDDSACILANALEHDETVQRVSLVNNQVGRQWEIVFADQGAIAFANCLLSNNHLEELKLPLSSRVSDEARDSLCRAMKLNICCTKLDIYHVSCSNAHQAEITRLCRQNRAWKPQERRNGLKDFLDEHPSVIALVCAQIADRPTLMYQLLRATMETLVAEEE